MKRVLTALTTVVILALAGVAAAAVAAGTYSGMSTFTLAGTLVSKPFSVTVKGHKVVDISLLATSECAALDGSTGIKVKFPIKKNAFKGTVPFTGGSFVKVKGTFAGAALRGTFTGTAKGGGGSSCAVEKSSFSATLG